MKSKNSLGELAKDITVGFVGSMANEYVAKGIPFLRSLNVRPYSYNPNNLKYISPKFHEKIKKSKLEPGDVVVVRTGNPGASCVIPESLREANCSDLVIVKCGERLDPHFVSYYINSVTHSHVKNQSVGAIQKHFNIGSAKELPFPDLNKNQQARISSVLRAIDEKIEINNKINAELEAMAKTLYDYWFVQFDFPETNRNPYKTSGGKMVYNPVLKRDIPEGWKIEPIEEFANIIDPHPSHRAPREMEHGYPFAGIGDIDESGNIALNKARVIDEEYVSKQEKDYEIGPYSIGYGRVGTVGKVVRLRKQKFRYALSPTLSVINPRKPEFAGFVYTSIKSEEFYKQVLKNTSGTTRPAIGIQQLRKIPVLKPGSNHSAMFEEFEEITKELFERSSVSNQENQYLIELRDWLLPMLVTGQVTVRAPAKSKAEVA